MGFHLPLLLINFQLTFRLLCFFFIVFIAFNKPSFFTVIEPISVKLVALPQLRVKLFDVFFIY